MAVPAEVINLISIGMDRKKKGAGARSPCRLAIRNMIKYFHQASSNTFTALLIRITKPLFAELQQLKKITEITICLP